MIHTYYSDLATGLKKKTISDGYFLSKIKRFFFL